MSACLFTHPLSWYERVSVEEIKTEMAKWQKIVDEFEQANANNDLFHAQRYAGYRQNLEQARFYLAGVSRGLNS